MRKDGIQTRKRKPKSQHKGKEDIKTEGKFNLDFVCTQIASYQHKNLFLRAQLNLAGAILKS